jgi:HEPN domain-containing protein
MSPRARGRQQACDHGQAETRLSHARKFLEIAKLAATEKDLEESVTAAVALAVLAGIAASDAACCAALGHRFRGADHREAAELLEQVSDAGNAANALRRLLGQKDAAHYGLEQFGRQDLESALRQAGTVVDFAESVLRR